MSDGVAMRKLGYKGESHYFSLPQRPPLGRALAINVNEYYTTKNIGLLDWIFGQSASKYTLSVDDLRAASLAEKLRWLADERVRVKETLKQRRDQLASQRDVNVRLANELIESLSHVRN